jgi:hypothetical protein
VGDGMGTEVGLGIGAGMGTEEGSSGTWVGDGKG